MSLVDAMMLNFFLLLHSNLDRYGLFSQTSASDSNLIPSNSAKLLDNDIDMIEFLGRVIGKALYKGILLDY
jgi:ubiquitin-protein ligase E3 B